MQTTPDWQLIVRYALLAAVCQLIPIPLVDGWAEDMLRRRLTRLQAARHDVELPKEDLSMLSDAHPSGCSALIVALVLWPIKKLIKTFAFVLQIKDILDVITDVVHRSLMIEEALQRGWIPSDAIQVRAAVNRAKTKVETRMVERSVRSVWRTRGQSLFSLLRGLPAMVRQRVRMERLEELDPIGAAKSMAAERSLSKPIEALISKIADALQAGGVKEKAVEQFLEEIRLRSTLAITEHPSDIEGPVDTSHEVESVVTAGEQGDEE